MADTLTYAVVRADLEYLWATYGAAGDMTGGYVDQDGVVRLFLTPATASARDCYAERIEEWFQYGPERVDVIGWMIDPAVEEIARRHGCEDRLNQLCDVFG